MGSLISIFEQKTVQEVTTSVAWYRWFLLAMRTPQLHGLLTGFCLGFDLLCWALSEKKNDGKKEY